MTNSMSKFETVLHSKSDCLITLFHDPDDFMSWIVRKWKRRWIGKKCLVSRWFNTREQAEHYAQQLVRECGGRRATLQA
jgi:hypothetical protein